MAALLTPTKTGAPAMAASPVGAPGTASPTMVALGEGLAMPASALANVGHTPMTMTEVHEEDNEDEEDTDEEDPLGVSNVVHDVAGGETGASSGLPVLPRRSSWDLSVTKQAILLAHQNGMYSQVCPIHAPPDVCLWPPAPVTSVV